MRIAVIGTHGTGKTSLIEDTVAARPRYQAVPEPYWDMVAAGVAFSDPPTLDEFVAQLDHSQQTIRACAAESDVLFDRCPLDLLAYVETLNDRTGADWAPDGRLLAGILSALATLDLVVWLDGVAADEIAGPVERPGLRRALAERLQRILEDDELGVMDSAPPVVPLRGTRAQRLQRMLHLIDGD